MPLINNDDGLIDWRPGTAGNAEITNIVANTPGQGQGARLMALALAEMREAGYTYVYLFSEWKNAHAHYFYRRQGFLQIATIADFYRHDDGVLFGRRL